MSTKERAARLRAEYKSRGWNARKVSVRTEYFSMGSAIHVTVRSAEVNFGEAIWPGSGCSARSAG